MALSLCARGVLRVAFMLLMTQQKFKKLLKTHRERAVYIPASQTG